MTLLEILVVLAIMALAASGLSFSLGALSRTNLRAAAGRLGSAVRFSYNRAIVRDETVRIHFTIPGNKFTIEEAHAGVVLTRKKEREDKRVNDDTGKAVASVDPWAAAKARLAKPLEPSVGTSPFHPIGSDGLANGTKEKGTSRFKDVSLGRGIQIIKLIVAHEPEPLREGDGAVHFFAGGRTEHAVIQLGDGHEGVYSVEIHPLTGRVKIHPDAFEPKQLLDNPEEKPISEVSDQ
jgi:type II secretory pathway pseudopilin PulG